jgi:hypothetical protein
MTVNSRPSRDNQQFQRNGSSNPENCRSSACVTGDWGEQGLETGNCHSSEKSSKKRAESQPSGARFVGWLFVLQYSTCC